MSLDVNELARTMLGAARDAVSDRWPQIQDLAEVEFQRLAASIADTGRLAVEGKITEARARHIAHMHQISARSILCTVEGLGIHTAEQALTAGIRSVIQVVNGAVKFALL
jgi:hypothetical protein